MNDVKLNGRVAIITGGSGGIGRAISIKLAKAGAKVLMLGRDALKGSETEARILSLGGNAVFFQVDLLNDKEVACAVGKILDRYGRVDILVNNAAISGFMGPVVSTPVEALESTLRMNLISAFYLSSLVLPGMIEHRHGRIINISSVAYKKNTPNSASYNMSKAGLNTFTKTLSKEVASLGITVNAVAPGLVLTERIITSRLPFLAERAGITADELLSRFENETDTKRLSNENDVAELVNFLASPAAQNITGSIMDVAGGF